MEYSKEKVLELISPTMNAMASLYMNSFDKAMKEAGVNPVTQVMVLALFIKEVSTIDPNTFAAEIKARMENPSSDGAKESN